MFRDYCAIVGRAIARQDIGAKVDGPFRNRRLGWNIRLAKVDGPFRNRRLGRNIRLAKVDCPFRNRRLGRNIRLG